MFNRLKKLRSEPYPFYYEKGYLPFILGGIFLFGTTFLFLFQPFNNNFEEHKFPFIVICATHAFVAIITLLPIFLVADYMLKDKNKWTFSKEFFLILFGFIAVGISNYLIRDLIYEGDYDNWNPRYLKEEIQNAFAIGVLVYPFFLLLNNYRLKSKYQKESAELNKTLIRSLEKREQKITILNSSGFSELSLLKKNLLFIKSEGNYVAVFYKDENVQKKMIRNTLTAVSKNCPDFFRPHRSYLVNQNNIARIGGNSQGYTLHFENCDFSVPVSRNKKEDLIRLQNSNISQGTTKK